MIKTTLFKNFPGSYWEKGEDFIDGTPRYRLIVPRLIVPRLIESTSRYCDSLTSPFRWHAVVFQESVTGRHGFPTVKRYFAVVEDCRMEKSSHSGPFKHVKDARIWAEREILDLMGITEEPYNAI